jgi:hypothetical protein
VLDIADVVGETGAYQMCVMDTKGSLHIGMLQTLDAAHTSGLNRGHRKADRDTADEVPGPAPQSSGQGATAEPPGAPEAADG